MLIQGQRVPDAVSSLSLLHQKVVCQGPLAEVERRAELLGKVEAASSVRTPGQCLCFHARVLWEGAGLL